MSADARVRAGRVVDPRSGEVEGLAVAPRFGTGVRPTFSDEERDAITARVAELEPWFQGPFVLADDLAIVGDWRNDARWVVYDAVLPDVTGWRVLDVGSNAGYDPFMFHRLGAALVVACEPFEFIEQARFLEEHYRTGVELRHMGWQGLDPDRDGRFDLVHCNGVLYHEPDPFGMLMRLRSMLADDGLLVFGSMGTADPHVSEYLRFVPGFYGPDPTWWFLPGKAALWWMLEAAGFTSIEEIGTWPGAPGPFPSNNYYLTARAGTPSPHLGGAVHHAWQSGESGPVVRFPAGHYYSSIYDTRDIARRREQIWPATPRDTVGIAWREDEQVRLARDVFATHDHLELRQEPSDDPTEYFASNDQYPALDAWVLEGMLRHLRPRHMVEIGSGFSSLITARVNREHLDGTLDFACIEPYPRDFLVAGVPGISSLHVERIEEAPLERFASLGANDVLFIDTSHTVKTGGDVTWIFEEIVPRLQSGVYVHVHDIFLPGDYPEPWVLEGWGWNETYLVRAFLAFNDAFEIVWGNQFMLQRHLDEVLAAFPGHRDHLARGGTSLWFRRR